MGIARPLIVLLLLGAIVGVAIGQSPDGSPDYQILKGTSSVGEQNCWGCHRPGVYNPPMDPYIAMAPDLTDFNPELAEPLNLATQIAYVWVGPGLGVPNQLMDFRVTLDLSNAPSIQFVSDTPPYELSPPATGSIVIDPSVAAADPVSLTRDWGGFTSIAMPAGATDAIITVTPLNNDANAGPDIKLNVYPGSLAPTDDAYNSEPINNNGRGGSETFRADNSVFASSGYGNWSIEALAKPVDSATGDVTPFAQPIEFQVEVQAWFNASGETKMVQSKDVKIDRGQSTLMNWPLDIGTPTEGESLQFTVNFTFHYKHESQTTESDNWRDLTEVFTVPIEASPKPDYQFRLGSEAALIIIPDAPAGVSLSAISEIIGYLGAFLLVASVYTGGMFGKKSRRQLNVIFRGARRRVAFHNFLSYGIIAFTIVHTFIFMWDVGGPLAVDGFHWMVGLLWGGPSILSMLALGVTGAIQVPMIRKWTYSTWRWTHFWLAIAAIVFALVHILLDGANFTDLQQKLGWQDPIVPEGF